MNWLPQDGLLAWKVDILKVGFCSCCCCSVIVVAAVVVEGVVWKLAREIFVGLRVSVENVCLPIYQWQGGGSDRSKEGF